MKKAFKILVILCFTASFTSANAQLFKRLKKRVQDKIERKAEKKADETIDKTIDGIGKKKKRKSSKDKKGDKKSFGSVLVNHSNVYGNIEISEISQVKVERNKNGYIINGSWWTHEADIYDGFKLQISTNESLKHDEADFNESVKRTFSIPDEAQLMLAYDPKLPYNKTNTKDNFKRAVTDDYQDVEISRGEITVDVLSDDAIQISFSGDVTLKKIIRTDSSEDYTESFFESNIKGAIDAQSPKFLTTNSRNKDNDETKNEQSQIPTVLESSESEVSGSYNFSFETKVKMTNLDNKEVYYVSYLLNPNAKYIGIKADMGDYSEEEIEGESIIILDDGKSHIFIETQGMKMRMSPKMMGNQQTQNPSEQMTNYDYNGIQKTGNTKTILGAKCYEYSMSDDDVKMTLWVAPSVNLPNWFIQNSDILDGHIMEYSIASKDGNVKSETVEINDNISKTLNPKAYKKMF